MSGGGLVEVLARHFTGSDPRTHESTCTCGWRGPWRLGEPFAAIGDRNAHLADVVTAHLAVLLEGCRDSIAWALDDEMAATEDGATLADSALAHVRSALGLEPPSNALGGAVDGRTGRSGTSMQGERAGDGG